MKIAMLALAGSSLLLQSALAMDLEGLRNQLSSADANKLLSRNQGLLTMKQKNELEAYKQGLLSDIQQLEKQKEEARSAAATPDAIKIGAFAKDLLNTQHEHTKNALKILREKLVQHSRTTAQEVEKQMDKIAAKHYQDIMKNKQVAAQTLQQIRAAHKMLETTNQQESQVLRSAIDKLKSVQKENQVLRNGKDAAERQLAKNAEAESEFKKVLSNMEKILSAKLTSVENSAMRLKTENDAARAALKKMEKTIKTLTTEKSNAERTLKTAKKQIQAQIQKTTNNLMHKAFTDFRRIYVENKMTKKTYQNQDARREKEHRKFDDLFVDAFASMMS